MKINWEKKGSPRRSGLVLALWLALGLMLTACGADTTSLSLATTTPAAATTAASTTAANATTAGTTAVQPTTTAPRTTNPPATTAAATTASATTAAAATTASTGATKTPTNATTAAATGTAAAVPTVSVPAAVKQEMDKVASQTEKTRGLTFKQPVERNFMTRADLAKYQQEQFYRDNSPQALAVGDKTWKIFAFVPANFDYAQSYINLLNEQVLGFYDPQTKKLYLVVDGDPNKVDPVVKFTAEHELTHGLQDQYYDLQNFLPTRKDSDTEWNDDQSMASLGLIEGDAVQSQLIWVQGGNMSAAELQQLTKTLSSYDQKQLENSPLILRDSLEFPYNEGQQFVQGLYNKGGWAAVNDAFKSYPPKSTSQILHPAKYASKIEPVKVALPSLTDTLGSGWKSIDINTLGEFQARIWLQGAMDNKTAVAAVSGWAGDRYQVLENGQGQLGLVWRSQWDSETDATNFYKASIPAVKQFYNLNGEGGSDPKRTWNGSSQDVSVIRNGKEVLITVLPKGAGVDKIASKLGF